MSETNKNAPAQQNNESDKENPTWKGIKGIVEGIAVIGGAVATIGGGLAKLLSAFDKDEK